MFSAMLPAPLVPPPKCSGHTSSDWQGGRTFAYGDTVRGATGGIVEVGGECYGDAVNVAARLCERFGPAENGLHNFLSCWLAVSRRNAPASWGLWKSAVRVRSSCFIKWSGAKIRAGLSYSSVRAGEPLLHRPLDPGLNSVQSPGLGCLLDICRCLLSTSGALPTRRGASTISAFHDCMPALTGATGVFC